MSIIYTCRHCDQYVGKLNQSILDTTLLGFDQLTIEEKREMIHYKNNGDIHIITICENCEDTLGEHPHYHELDFFIQ